MMSSESCERRPERVQHIGRRQPEMESFSCPRCGSTNTKFCYYNNYNLSQPRHFCKSCRRYWTRGGALRNIPIGGVTRKSAAKRRRCSPSASTVTTAASTSNSTNDVGSSSSNPTIPSPVSPAPGFKPEMVPGSPETGTFASFLDLGLGPGFHDMCFGFSSWAWPVNTAHNAGGATAAVNRDGGCGGGGGRGGSGAGESSGCNTWQIGAIDGGGLSDSDSFGWPDLAISAPGQSIN